MKERKHKHKHHDRKRSHVKDGVHEYIKIKEEPLSDEDSYRTSNKRDRETFSKHRHDSSEEDQPHKKRERERNSSSSSHHKVHERDAEHRNRNTNDKHKERNGHTTREENHEKPWQKKRIKEEPQEYEWGKKEIKSENDKKGPPVNKAKPDFGLSGKLTEETNTYNGIVIKYSEPPEARKPVRRWRFYPFKGEDGLPTLHLHRQSAYLIGRERKIADIPVDHPSCSKQHAVLQYRLVTFTRENGTTGKRVRPYIIDLESANGTYVNNQKIDSKKYIELLEKDVIKFGYSSRDYVLLHEHSKDSDQDDDM
uniref:FHA domain-containing protein n=1 Tax=Clastoptera arizonana TaxID=38151 RepID=A0A1B6E2L4_9HEMI